MKYPLLLILFVAYPLFAQEVELPKALEKPSMTERLPLPLELEVKPEDGGVVFSVEDIDDITANISLGDNLQLFASASNVFEIDMYIDWYEEDQLTDFSPKAIDDIYPVDGSSRSICAGIQLTF